VLTREGEQSQMTGPLDRYPYAALMPGTQPGLAAWANLSPFRYVATKDAYFFVVNVRGVLCAESANPWSSPETASTGASAASARRSWRFRLFVFLGIFREFVALVKPSQR
jgi:hypothetical protein